MRLRARGSAILGARGSPIFDTLRYNGKTIQVIVLFDTGATRYLFIDSDFAQRLQLLIFPLKQPRNLEGFDGKPTDTGPITSYALADFQVPGGPMESTPFFVTRLPQVPIIIGLSWMRHH